MKELIDKEQIKTLIKNLLNQALNGSGALKSAEKLAQEYIIDSKYSTSFLSTKLNLRFITILCVSKTFHVIINKRLTNKTEENCFL